MTTAEIEAKLNAQTKEINKLKTFNTKLAKKLVENNIDVPVPNWSKENSKEVEAEGSAAADS